MKKVYESLVEQTSIEVPFNVVCVFGSKAKHIAFSGNTFSFAEDFVTLEEGRAAIEYYVDQLGGKVKWNK